MNQRGFWRWVMVVVCGFSCTPTQSNEAEELTNSEAAAVCGAWAPTWRQGSGATTQWVEWVIQGNAAVKAAWIEASGQQLALAPLDGGWGAPTSVPAGTQMILHARTDDGEEAQTLPFGYLDTPEPMTDPNACANACSAPWDPLWQQGTTANNYWMDWTVSRGTVTSVSLEVVGGATTQLSHSMGRWTATVPGGITTGTPIVLHATDASGRTAFRLTQFERWSEPLGCGTGEQLVLPAHRLGRLVEGAALALPIERAHQVGPGGARREQRCSDRHSGQRRHDAHRHADAPRSHVRHRRACRGTQAQQQCEAGRPRPQRFERQLSRGEVAGRGDGQQQRGDAEPHRGAKQPATYPVRGARPALRLHAGAANFHVAVVPPVTHGLRTSRSLSCTGHARTGQPRARCG